MSGEEPAWVRIQKKTFTRWCNNYLVQRGAGVNDLQKDLQDGVQLHTLLEILGGEEVIPKLKLQMVENLNSCLRYIKAKNINLVNIGAEDLYDGKIKLILGLIWTLILRFQIMGEDEESANARAALLDWCNSVLNPQGLAVKNFTGDWQDGRCFCGLVNAIEPGAIPLNTVPATEAESNMNKAFTRAEELFGFPQVLDAVDVLEHPDDLSIMTYVSYFRAYMMANNAFGPNCTAEGPGLIEATTHEEAPFTITTYNEDGDRVERGGAMIKCSLVDEQGVEVTSVRITDNRDGTYSAHYVAERPGNFKLDILVKKQPIKGSPFHPVVKAGEPMPGLCEAHGPGISAATAGNEVGFTVVTKDVAGRLIPRGGAQIAAVLKDPKGDITVTIVDQEDGTYAATYTPVTAGTSTLSVVVTTKFNGTGEIKAAPFSVLVSPGDVNVAQFKWDGLELDAEGRHVVVAGTTDAFTVTAHDSHGNRLAQGGLNIHGKVESGPIEFAVATHDSNDGSYRLEYTPTKTGQYAVAVHVDQTPIGGHANPFPLLVIPADACGANSIASGPGLNAGKVGGDENVFHVETRDAFDNPLTEGGANVAATLVHNDSGNAVPVNVRDNSNGTYSADYAGVSKAGTYTLTPTVNGEPVKDAPFTVKVTEGNASAEHFKWQGLELDAEGNVLVVAGTQESFTVIAHDQHGNRQSAGGLHVKGTISDGPTPVDVDTHDQNDGAYKLEYTPIKSGRYTFIVTLDDTPIGGNTNPFHVVCIPSDPYGPTSIAEGDALHRGVAGAPNAFKLRVHDRYENALTQGGADVRGNLALEGSDETVPLTVEDLNDGSYTLAYPNATKAGTYTLTPTVQGEPVKDSPFTVTVSEGEPDPECFVWEGLELDGDGQNVIVAGHVGTFTVIAHDSYGNRITTGGISLNAALKGTEDVEVTVNDRNDGSYDVEYAPTHAGVYALTVALNEKPIGGSPNPFGVVCIPGEPYGPTSLAEGHGVKDGVAGHDNVFIVRVHDRFENALTEGGAEVGGELVREGGGEAVPLIVVDQGDGTYVCTYPGVTKAGTYKLTPTVQDDAVKDAPFIVTVREAEADAAHFVWEGPELDADGQHVVVAGEMGQLRVVAHDKHGNRVTTGGLAITGTIDGGPPVEVAVEDGGDGSYTLSYSPTRADKYTVTVALLDAPLGGHVNPFPLRCIPAEAHGPSSHATGEGLHRAVAGEANLFLVGARDRFYNDCIVGGASVAATLTHAETGNVVNAEVVDDADGTYEVTYAELTAAGTYSLVPIVAGEGIEGSPFTVVVDPAAPSAAHFTWDEVASEIVAGETGVVRVTARDAFGNQLKTGGLALQGRVSGADEVTVNVVDKEDGTYELSYTPTVTGSYSVAVSLNEKPVGGHENPFSLTCIPAEAHGPSSIPEGDALQHGNVGKPNTFRVQVRDRFGNVRTQGGDTVHATMLLDDVATPVSVKDEGNGIYSLSYADVTQAGSYTLTPTVGDEPVKDAPFTVTVGAGDFDPNGTQVEIPKPGHAGRRGPRVAVKDTQGNLRAGFDDDVVADLTPVLQIKGVKARGGEDGVYEIDYPPTLLPGPYEIGVRVNGQDAPGAPYTAPIELNALNEEDSAVVDEIMPEAAAVLKRLLLNATDSERNAVISTLRELTE